MEVKIARRAPLRVAFMRHVGPYSAVGKTSDRFLPVLGKEGLLGGDTQFIGLCHDDPEVTPPSRVRYDACVSVDERFSPTGEIGVQMLAGGEYAVTTHVGPYDQECLTIARMKEFAATNQREFHGRHHEIYLSDPRRVPPERLKTLLRCPVRPQSRL